MFWVLFSFFLGFWNPSLSTLPSKCPLIIFLLSPISTSGAPQSLVLQHLQSTFFSWSTHLAQRLWLLYSKVSKLWILDVKWRFCIGGNLQIPGLHVTVTCSRCWAPSITHLLDLVPLSGHYYSNTKLQELSFLYKFPFSIISYTLLHHTLLFSTIYYPT